LTLEASAKVATMASTITLRKRVMATLLKKTDTKQSRTGHPPYGPSLPPDPRHARLRADVAIQARKVVANAMRWYRLPEHLALARFPTHPHLHGQIAVVCAV
jgi:hypothetical protein